MAGKTGNVSDMPSLGMEMNTGLSFKIPKFTVVGHRGHGMNDVQSTDKRMKAWKNTIASFNAAARHNIQYIEFDVQVTKDGCPIVFHDDVIYSQTNDGSWSGKEVKELTLSEFLAYGPQKDPNQTVKPLAKKINDFTCMRWEVETDDSNCTLQEAFQNVDSNLGFNIELKFKDDDVYTHDQLIRVLQAVLRVPKL